MYLGLIVEQLNHGSNVRIEINRRFCMQDAELNGMLLKLSRGHDRPTHRGATTELEQRREVPSVRTPRPNVQASSKRPVPNDVARAAPRQDGKQLCLRYISMKGCPSPSTDRCTHHFLGHFMPTQLDPIVRAYIVDKYGGLRGDVQNAL